MATTYVDYTYYTTTFLGSAITSAEFALFAKRASHEVDKFTFNRAADIVLTAEDAELVDNIKMATCAVADVLKTISDRGPGGAIASERVGQLAVTYVQQKVQSDGDTVRNAAKQYLGFSGLMFPGLDSVDED